MESPASLFFGMLSFPLPFLPSPTAGKRADSPSATTWTLPFLELLQSDNTATEPNAPNTSTKTALIILNQPFSKHILVHLWSTTSWRCCADGGANRLYDLFDCAETGLLERDSFLPDLIKGDLDSIRDDVRAYYESKGVPIIKVKDEYSTDLMKCLSSLSEKEVAEGQGEYTVVLLSGFSGRLDQTVHTLSYLHKLRKSRQQTFVVTDDNVAWVLNEGQHLVQINHAILGPTCGLLPVGIESARISTSGLRWNLTDQESSFDGLISTSNHLVPEENVVWIKTSQPIWWCIELRR